MEGWHLEDLTTQFKGKITEMQVALALLQKGYMVSQPLVDARYDFLLEANRKFYRIQVKTCHLVDDESGIQFNTSNSHTNTQGTTNRDYKGEADLFATFYNGDCYLIPVEECGSRNKKLRILPIKNGRKAGISFLEDYTVEKILSE